MTNMREYLMSVTHAKMIGHAFWTLDSSCRLLYTEVPRFQLTQSQIKSMRKRIRSEIAKAAKNFGGVTPKTYPEFRTRSISVLLNPEEADDIVRVLEAMAKEGRPNPPHIHAMLDIPDLKCIDEAITIMRSGREVDCCGPGA